jgi:ABC-type branched-subunit amino acid transport system substrate-binding protein
MSQFPLLSRRGLLRGSLLAAVAGSVLGQPARKSGSAPVTVVQILDTSMAQQDVAKDFLLGSRAAWHDINAQGGLRGRVVLHETLEVDGSAAAVRQALQAAVADPSCVALSGTVGDPVAAQVVQLLTAAPAGLAQIAPWLQNSSIGVGDSTFPIFAGRAEQVAHALKSLALVGVQDVGVVYASALEQRRHQDDIARVASGMDLRLAAYLGSGDLSLLGQRLGPRSPAILLFVGGTPELVQFTHGLDRQQRQRFVIALADVNLQAVQQMGGARSTPLIATQTVPMVTSTLPIVRHYREVMARLFDEPPVALSLAGFVAARATFAILQGIDGPLTRAAVLAACQRQQPIDLGGLRVSFDPRRGSRGYVTQTMLTAGGRVVG